MFPLQSRLDYKFLQLKRFSGVQRESSSLKSDLPYFGAILYPESSKGISQTLNPLLIKFENAI